MKKSIVLGLVALSLVACGKKEEVAPAPAAEVAAPAADAAPAVPAEGVTATADPAAAAK